MVAQQNSPCLHKNAVRHQWVPPASLSWCRHQAGEQQEPEAGSSWCVEGRHSPSAGTLTAAQRETVLQQSVVYLYLLYINALKDRFQQISRASGRNLCRAMLSSIARGVFNLAKGVCSCLTVVKLAPISCPVIEESM